MAKTESVQLKAEETKKRLDLAKTFLRLAKKLTENKEDYRGAVDLGYNSTEHCLKGFILLEQDTIPRRHSGIVQCFSELYIKTGKLEKSLSRRTRQALKFRNLARYDPDATIGEMMVGEVLSLAKDTVELLTEHISS